MPKFYNIKHKRISARNHTSDMNISLERHEQQIAHNRATQQIILNNFYKKVNEKEQEIINNNICIIS